MSASISTHVVTVSDLEAAKAVYGAVLGTPHTDAPYYVGFNLGGFEFGLTPGDPSSITYVSVEDLDAAHAAMIAAGATEQQAPTKVAPELRVSVLVDKDGNKIGLNGK